MDADRLERFSAAERWIHLLVGVLMLVCLATAAILYNASLSIAVGNRDVVERVHVWCGFALPVPLVLGLLSRAYRADLRRLDRFSRVDWTWLRSSARRSGRLAVGKFNAGQKLNAALSTGAILVLLITGVTMYFTGLAPLDWRTGATFVHDWTALAVGLLVAGHTVEALRDREAMRGIIRGDVPLAWARHEHPAWVAELSRADRP